MAFSVVLDCTPPIKCIQFLLSFKNERMRTKKKNNTVIRLRHNRLGANAIVIVLPITL